MSNEVSAFIICLITLDRFIVLRFPFSQRRLRPVSASVSCLFVWLFGAALALIPIVQNTIEFKFYDQNGVENSKEFKFYNQSSVRNSKDIQLYDQSGVKNTKEFQFYSQSDVKNSNEFKSYDQNNAQNSKELKFYGQSGVCIPLPITRTNMLLYSFAIMIVMNFVLFAIVAVGQVRMKV